MNMAVSRETESSFVPYKYKTYDYRTIELVPRVFYESC